MKYTHETFIQLLEKHFGRVLYNGRYYIDQVSNKEVAEALDYSEKQFSACLNPTDQTSFKTVINRLLKLSYIKSLEEQNEQLRSENALLGQKNRLYFYLLPLFIIIGIAIAFSGKRSGAKLASKGYLVDSPGQLENIMNWHRHGTMNALAWKGLVLNARVKECEVSLTEEEKERIIVDAIRDVRETMKTTRVNLYNVGFVTNDGRNLADLLEEIAPHDGLLKERDSLFSSPFADAIPYLLSDDAPALEIANTIIKISTEVQHREWEAMKRIISTIKL